MACDRFVWFERGQVPPKEDVGRVLEDYLGDFLVKNEWGGGRWNVQLVGSTSWPFRRLAEVEGTAQATFWNSPEAKRDRWFEVYIGDDNIDVITRQSDEVTNNIADGFAKLLARFWQGRLDDE